MASNETIYFYGRHQPGTLKDALAAAQKYRGNGLIISRRSDPRLAFDIVAGAPNVRFTSRSNLHVEMRSGARIYFIREGDTERARGLVLTWILTDGADPGDTLLRLRPAVPLDGPGEPETSGPGMMRIQPQEPWPETAKCACGQTRELRVTAPAASSPPGVTFPSVINSMYRVELATKAKRTATAKLTRIAERSRDTLKREAARVELMARMAPAPLPAMRDDWDQLPDAEPGGIVRRS